MDSTSAFVMALLALAVAAVSAGLSLLTFLHSRRRDFPRARMVLHARRLRDEAAFAVEVENLGAGSATRIFLWIWSDEHAVWINQGPWLVSMIPGDRMHVKRFELGKPVGVKITWHDEARPEKRRKVVARWSLKDQRV